MCHQRTGFSFVQQLRRSGDGLRRGAEGTHRMSFLFTSSLTISWLRPLNSRLLEAALLASAVRRRFAWLEELLCSPNRLCCVVDFSTSPLSGFASVEPALCGYERVPSALTKKLLRSLRTLARPRWRRRTPPTACARVRQPCAYGQSSYFPIYTKLSNRGS